MQGKHRPDSEYIEKAKNIASSINEPTRSYLALGIGLFLFLFSIGYFNFLRITIGLLGAGLIAWGAVQSGLINKATVWFNKLFKRS